MVKIFVTFFTVAVIASASVWGLSEFLSPDDLKSCPAGPAVNDSKCAPAQVIVAISGGDTQGRTREAIALYKKGWAPQLIFSGAAADPNGPSNAQAMRTQAINAGVPKDVIFLDSAAADTFENAKGASALLSGGDRRMILVTSPYHQRRASIEFHKVLGDSVKILNHPTSTDSAWSDNWWLTPYGWFLALSEVGKIMVISLWR